MSGGGTQKTTQSSAPWEAQQPYLKSFFTDAQKLYKSGGLAPSVPKQNLAGQSAATTGALDQFLQTGQSISPGLQAALDQANRTAAGEYLNGNPHIDANIDRAIGKALPGVNAQASRSGRTGSGAAQNAVAGTAAGIANEAYMQNYDAERQRQLQALTAIPGLSQAQYLPAQMMAQVGATQDARAQQELDAKNQLEAARVGRAQSALQNYGSLIQGNYGMSSTGTQPGRSLGATLLGGASAGAGLGSLLGGQSGAGFGAAAGGLLGLFG